MWNKTVLSKTPREDDELKKQHRHGDTPWYARVLPVRVVLAFWASVIVTALLCIPLAVEASNARENLPRSDREIFETSELLKPRSTPVDTADDDESDVADSEVSVLGASETNDGTDTNNTTSVERLSHELRWSANPDNVAAGPNDLLHGATLDGVVYVFLELNDVAQVDFWLNGKLTATDRSAPWELFGGGALDTQHLEAGRHTIGALATSHDGTVQLIEAEFFIGE